MAASDTLKRLEEIEAAPALGHLRSLRGMQSDIEWLCARLRDALTVIEATSVDENALSPLGHTYKSEHDDTDYCWEYVSPVGYGDCGRGRSSHNQAALAAYRRLFGEEESRD